MGQDDVVWCFSFAFVGWVESLADSPGSSHWGLPLCISVTWGRRCGLTGMEAVDYDGLDWCSGGGGEQRITYEWTQWSA